MQPNNKEVYEIDIKELFLVLLGKIWIIVFAGIICALCAGLYSKLIIKPIYISSTKIYVISRQNEDRTTYSDLQTGTQLTKDYEILVMSRPVTEQVISLLNLDMTHEQLVSSITISTPSETRILKIDVRNTDPYIAKQLVDAIAEVSAERMVSIMEMEKASIVEQGNIPSEPSSPNISKNVFLGGAAGVFIAVAIIILFYIMNDTIKSIDDIERYLGITALGSIPMEVKSVNSYKNKESSYKIKIFKGGNKSERN